MNLCVVGAGYVGLVTGAVFADLGNDVVCVDSDRKKVEMLKKGRVPIYEPGLQEMVSRNLEDGRLVFTSDLRLGVERSEIIFICVSTPAKDDGETDLSYVEEVAKGIGQYINTYKVIVNKSTVPVGTGDLVREIIEQHKHHPDVSFDVVSNPEFLREGSAIQDTLRPDRIVIGAPGRESTMKLLELYHTLECPMVITDVHSAEIIKYASNAFLSMKVSFVNAISDICEAAGADIRDVVRGMGYDSRIGKDYLNPGLGFGGSCFPKDLESLLHTSRVLGCEFGLWAEIININRQRVAHFMGRVEEVLGGLEGKVIGVLGLSFKPDTDDIRGAKSTEVLRYLLDHGARVKAYDPAAMENVRPLFPQVQYCESSYGAADGVDGLLIVTEWREFKQLNLQRLRDRMRRPAVFDGRNIYDPKVMGRLGFEYHMIGWRTAPPEE